MAAGQAGIDPTLVQKDQVLRIDRGQLGTPTCPSCDDIWPVLLLRAQGLFWVLGSFV
jgi:hypothetical protein